MRKRIDDLELSHPPLSDYGTLEKYIRAIREHNPLDLNAECWRERHPDGTFEEWRELARACLLEGLHYDPGPLDLRAETVRREERERFVFEHVRFNTTAWFRVNAYHLFPKNVPYPVPAVMVFHAWGTPILWGKEHVVNSGRDHPVVKGHRDRCYSGNYLAEEFARAGYATITIDAYGFGERGLRDFAGIPEAFDPFELTADEANDYDGISRRSFYAGVKHLGWAGTTWLGITYWDDHRCVDYLLTRPEVDPDRIACTGVSGGGWRTDVMAALDRRIRAAVSVCFMTSGDYQQAHDILNCVGTCCQLPGVWNRMDIPDTIVMSAPCACLVINGKQDTMFPPEGVLDAARQIRTGYEWAGCPERFKHYYPDTNHCYDADMQREAIAWFDQHLKET